MLMGKIEQLMVKATMDTDHIHLLGISTPFPVGKVNVYLFTVYCFCGDIE